MAKDYDRAHVHVRMAQEEYKAICQYCKAECAKRKEFYSVTKFLREAAQDKLKRGKR